MNLADLFIMSILLGITAWIFISMRKDKKENKGCHGCKGCQGCASRNNKLERDRW